MAETRDVSPEELQQALDFIRAGGKASASASWKGPVGPPRTWADVLGALDRGVIDKQEARKLLGYPRRHEPKHLREARARRRPAK